MKYAKEVWNKKAQEDEMEVMIRLLQVTEKIASDARRVQKGNQLQQGQQIGFL